MLPKYLTPPLSKKFEEAVFKKIESGLSEAVALSFVHNMISRFEDQGSTAFEALEKTHAAICAPKPL